MVRHARLLAVAAFGVVVSSCNPWREYASTEGRFAIMLPGVPIVADQSFSAPDGKRIVSQSATVKREDGMYQVTYSDPPVANPDLDAETLLDGVRDSLAANMKQWTILSESKVSAGATRGRALEFRIDHETFAHYRIYLHKVTAWRMYQVAVFTHTQEITPNATRCLDSFRIVG
jgi:hypothetical protein